MNILAKIFGQMCEKTPSIFVFKMKKGCFWMLNVLFPLQLVIVENNKVKEIKTMKPLSIKKHCGKGDMFIELPTTIKVDINDNIRLVE